MIKFLLHLLFLSLLCVGLSRCKHEPPPEPPAVCQYNSSIEEMKKWYYFKTGTRWVYQEQTSGALDTLTVYHDWAGINTGGFEGFEWFATSSYDESFLFYTFNTSFTIHCLTQENCQCHKVDREKAQIGNYIGSGRIFLYPLIEGNYTASGAGWCTLMELHQEYTIEDFVYEAVAEWNIEDDDSEANSHTKYWIGMNSGIVRYQNLTLGSDWILVESNIIQ